MSLAKLTSLSTTTLSLLLERQRMQTLDQPAPTAILSMLPQIQRNLDQLRVGILELERTSAAPSPANGAPQPPVKIAGNTPKEALRLLRNQHERMRGMLGADGAKVESLGLLPSESTKVETSRSVSPASQERYTPYSDEPEPGETEAVLEQQRLLMQEQDAHLDHLSHSIGRQRDISIQINDEIGTHNGLLEELDVDLDRTGDRLSGARRRLGRFSRGARENVSALTIGILIVLLLILVIVFKT